MAKYENRDFKSLITDPNIQADEPGFLMALAECCRSGNGIYPNMELAMLFDRIAAAMQKDETKKLSASELYAAGVRAEQAHNPAMARNYYLKAMHAGSYDGAKQLLVCALSGKGGPADPALADQCRDACAALGDAKEAYSQALDYLQAGNKQKALYWLDRVEAKDNCSDELLTHSLIAAYMTDPKRDPSRVLEYAWKYRELYDAGRFLMSYYGIEAPAEHLASLNEEQITMMYRNLAKRTDKADQWLNKVLESGNPNANTAIHQIMLSDNRKTKTRQEHDERYRKQMDYLEKALKKEAD